MVNFISRHFKDVQARTSRGDTWEPLKVFGKRRVPVLLGCKLPGPAGRRSVHLLHLGPAHLVKHRRLPPVGIVVLSNKKAVLYDYFCFFMYISVIFKPLAYQFIYFNYVPITFLYILHFIKRNYRWAKPHNDFSLAQIFQQLHQVECSRK